MRIAILALALWCVCPTSPAATLPTPTPWDGCFAQAGAYYRINPLLLKAIARQESAMKPGAIGQNSNGTQDYGLMQINSSHLSELEHVGVSRARLMDPCTNIVVGAWILAGSVHRLGMSWDAVGAYHSPTPWRSQDYATRIEIHLIREIQALRGRGMVAGQSSAPSAQPAPAALVAPSAAPAVSPAANAAPVSATLASASPASAP